MPGKPTNEGEQPLLTVAQVAGVDGTSAPYLLNPNNLVECTNFLPDLGYGALTTALGRAMLPGLSTPLQLPGPCHGMALFHRFDPYGIQPAVYVFAVDYEGAGTLWYLRVDGVGGLQQLLLGVGNTLTAGQDTFFAEAGVWLFLSNGTDTPLKIDNELLVTQWGIAPPATRPDPAGAQGGKLSYGQSPYYYCTTYGVKKTSVTQPGQESSQGAISAAYTMSQTPATGSVTIDSSISGIGAGYNFQFTVRLNGADYPYGAVYTTISTESAENAAHQIAAAINSAYPLAYTKGQNTGTLTVTATTALSVGGGAIINISIADSNGAAIDDIGYVKYYVDDLHAPSGGPWHCDPNQSDPANASGGSTDSAIQLTNIPISPDPQVTERNIYRLGGALGQWRLVTTLPDNLTTSYLDITSDVDLTGQALVVYRDSPPPFAFICGHQQRIFGFNTQHSTVVGPGDRNNSSSLWWSNYGEPWGFNALQNVLTVGESLEGDPGIGCASIGSMMGICKRYGFYGLYGNSDATWASGLFKISDTGCSSAKSIAGAYGMMGWTSRQGAYIWNGMGLPTNLSDGNFQQSNIKNVFDQTPLTDLKYVVGFWYARMLGFSFPRGQTYLYDPRSQGWWPLPYYTPQVIYDIESDVPVVAIRGGSADLVDAWFQSGTDLGLPLVATGVTRISGDPDMSWLKTLMHLLVDAPVTTASFAFQFVCDDGAQQTVWPSVLGGSGTAIDFSQGFPRHRVSTQQIEFVDMQMQFALTTTMPGTRINKIAAYGTLNRQFAPETTSDQ